MTIKTATITDVRFGLYERGNNEPILTFTIEQDKAVGSLHFFTVKETVEFIKINKLLNIQQLNGMKCQVDVDEVNNTVDFISLL